MPPENTYERFRRVLGEIADGAKNPQALAKAALNPWRPAPSYQWKIQTEARAKRAQARRDERTTLAKAAYADWLAAGRPPIAGYAKLLGLHRSKLERLLRHAEKEIPRGERRLGFTRSRDYRTTDELWAEKYPDDESPTAA